MNLIKKTWNKFKTKPDIWLFFGFLLTFTLSIRKVIFYFPLKGTFNEYSGIYVYISDIALILTLILWLISILCNNKITLSRIKLWITSVFRRNYLFLPLFLILLSFISISWSENKSIAIFRSIKLLEFYFLYIYIIFRFFPKMFHVEHFQARKEFHFFSWVIILLGLSQSIIGIIQFLIQKSIGLFWLKESLISPEILGVAKIILNGEKYIRAYGLMPHPNILGGFLLFSIIVTLLYRKFIQLTKQEQIVPRGTLEVHGTSAKKFAPSFLQEDGWDEKKTNLILNILIFIQILALILTFSKSAIIGLIISLIYINVPPASTRGNATSTRGWRGTFQELYKERLTKLFHACLPMRQVEHSKALLLSGMIILTFFFLIAKPDLNSLFFNSFKERAFYLNVPRGTFAQNPIFGSGAGQSVLTMQDFYSQTLEFWEYQPVHNVFLLIFSELGLIGLGLSVWFLWKLLTIIVPRLSADEAGGTIDNLQKGSQEKSNPILSNNNINMSSIIFHRYFKGILLGFIFIMLFDHYLWDIQQGSLLFWLIAGFISGVSINESRKY